MPEMHLVSTVLPAPLSSTSAVTSPRGMSRSTWYRAWTGPKCLSSSRTLSNGSSVARGSATAAVMTIDYLPIKEMTPPRSAAASVKSGLRDAGSRANGRGYLGAQGALVDEVVLDHRVLHVRLGDPDRDQQRSGLRVPGHA